LKKSEVTIAGGKVAYGGDGAPSTQPLVENPPLFVSMTGNSSAHTEQHARLPTAFAARQFLHATFHRRIS